jgi:hypothetical protein
LRLKVITEGAEEDDGTRNTDWRKLHNELHGLYCLPDIRLAAIRSRIRWAGHAAYMGFCLGHLKELDSLGRPKRRWEDNIKIKEIGWSRRGRG